MNVFALQCGVQRYAWGSTTLMADRFGWPDSDEPQAEMWIGAHSVLPSSVSIEGSLVALDAAIARDPQRWLGSAVVDRFGPNLPMLMKILAIAQPLSLQAHPSASQAAEGYAREDALGIDRAAPNRLYRDSRAKPELICALTAMDTLCGFRTVEECRSLLVAVGAPFAAFADVLAGPDDLPELVRRLLSLGHDAQKVLVNELLLQANALPWGVGALVRLLADRYPGDAGVVVSLLLNHITLAPGEALFLPAGNMHAYLSGLGVEVMANSDNVLRGGLTPKHVDVDELVATLVPIAGPWPLAASSTEDGVESWTTPAPEVMLSRATVASLAAPVLFPSSVGPTLLVVTDGTVSLSCGGIDDGGLELGPGDAAYALPGSDVRVVGFGTVWRSSVNLAG